MAALGAEMAGLAPAVAGLGGRDSYRSMAALSDALQDVLAGTDGADAASTARFMMSGTCQMILAAGNSLYGRVSPGRRQDVIDETTAALARAAWDMSGA